MPPKNNKKQAAEEDVLLSTIAEDESNNNTKNNNNKSAAKASSTLLEDEELFFTDPEQDEGFKQIVQSAANELTTKHNEDAKSEFQKNAAQLKWYQAARGWNKTPYELANLSQSQREDDSFFKNAYFFYNFSHNNVERFSKAFKVFAADDAPVAHEKKSQQQQQQGNSRYWQSSGKSSKTQKAYLRKVGGSLPNGSAAGSDDDDDEAQSAPVPYEDDLDEAKPAIPAKKRKLEDLDFEYNKKQDKSADKPPASKKQRIHDKLAKLQKEEANLADADEEEIIESKQQKKLESALKKAEGKRDNDNIKVLKNKVKKDQVKKKKSKKEWETRDKKLQQDMEKRREKKDENRKNKRLRGKKQSGGASDNGKAKKKGGRPGFEGKRTRPLNSRKSKDGGKTSSKQ